ncbi:MAG: glycosyltransferase family 1 protein [Candidatus Woesebacteria bacterium]|nr:glycosyltransferase family 1 protein [Candidatus Woesebacteria bacterium]
MKILIDGRLYGLENAGLGRYVMNLVGELCKLDRKNEYILLLRKKYFDNLNLPDNWKKVLADFRHYGLDEQIKFPGLINRENPDIVHFPHFNAPFLYRGKYVVTIHDMLMHQIVGVESTTLPIPLYFIKRLGYRFIFDNSVRHSEKIIVPSITIKEELAGFYKISDNKISVTYEGVDTKISYGDEDVLETPYFVYAGNAYPHKNLRRLIEAIALLNKNNVQKVKLMIASSRGIFTQRLERIIQDQNAGEYVRLLGFIPDNKLFTLYKNSAGFVFPSLSEGFGLPGLEAMASGTLVLASDIPVFREIYKDNAIYFNPLDISSIEKVMGNVLEMNICLRSEKIEKAKNFVKRYSWAKMAEETLKIYEDSNSLRPRK